jgi:hypothetical protein
MLSRDLLKYIAMLIIVAGLVYYMMKRAGHIEGMEPSNTVKEPSDIKRVMIQ